MGITYPRAHLWFLGVKKTTRGSASGRSPRRVIRAQALIERPWISVPENSTV